METTQYKLKSVRPARVQITYDVETEGAIQKKELDFVIGVIADLTRNPDSSHDKPFIVVNSENFSEVISKAEVKINISVNSYNKDNEKTPVEFTITKIEDFLPSAIVEKVDLLKELVSQKKRLLNLYSKLEVNRDFQNVLINALQNTSAATENISNTDTNKTTTNNTDTNKTTTNNTDTNKTTTNNTDTNKTTTNNTEKQTENAKNVETESKTVENNTDKNNNNFAKRK
jgi:type VI secretion system protein ImpB